jgi:hypothetical protein
MQKTSTDPADVASFLNSRHWHRICVDGTDGSGKSKLAHELATLQGAPVFKLDDFITGNAGGIVDFVNYDALRAALQACPSWIVEGVCLREVMRRAGQDVDAWLYVKRLSHDMWADEQDCVFPEGLKTALAHHRHDMLRLSRYLGAPEGGPPDPSIVRTSRRAVELMTYHDAYRPHDSADIIFLRNLDLG